jgi:hypothetical protein
VIAKRKSKVTTKIIDNVFFFIETPSFQLDVSDSTYIDEGPSDIIQKTIEPHK